VTPSICPYCQDPIHPANERRGHCNAQYCQGRQDERDETEDATATAAAAAAFDRGNAAGAAVGRCVCWRCGADEADPYERGRLDAIRADVERTIVLWARDAARLDRCADADGESTALGRASRLDAATVRRWVADCRRWLEATK